MRCCTTQLKIFSTAAFAVLLLGRNITSPKWRALLLLVLGCILVASPTFNRPVDCTLELLNASKKGNQFFFSSFLFGYISFYVQRFWIFDFFFSILLSILFLSNKWFFFGSPSCETFVPFLMLSCRNIYWINCKEKTQYKPV